MFSYKKIDPDFKRRWVEALRSGDYQQGKYSLRPEGAWCCLGVAYDVLGKKWRLTELGVWALDEFPSSLDEFMGRGNYQACSHLVTMNDVQGKSFDEIADWVEENL